MRPLVADASALLRLVLPEPGRDVVQKLVIERLGAGASVLVPSIAWLEVVNVMAHRHRLSGAQIIEAIHALDALGVETRELGREATLPVLDAVERHRLTAYDAAYLVLAESTDADLATADRELARAAGPRAVWIGPGGQIAEPPTRYVITPSWPSWRGAAAYLGELRSREAST